MELDAYGKPEEIVADADSPAVGARSGYLSLIRDTLVRPADEVPLLLDDAARRLIAALGFAPEHPGSPRRPGATRP